MIRKKRGPVDFVAWIALSAYGHPAPFIGLAFTRTELKKEYSARFHGDLEIAGYRALKVRVAEKP
jgi:hypothetical protein